MIDRDHGLSLDRQTKALGISRSGVYHLPRPVSDVDLELMRRIDEPHMEYPFAGSRMLKGLLNGEGHEVGRCHVATLMKRMGVAAIYRRPNTSRPAPGHKIYPYLLRNVAVTRPDQVWAMDITYVPPLGRLLRNRLPGNGWPAVSSIWPPSSTGSAGRS